MSFDSREQSIHAGRPFRLYEFRRGVMRWRHTTGDSDQTLSAALWRTVRGGISDKGLRQSGVAKQDDFIITAPADIEVAQPFRNSHPSAKIGVLVYDGHHGVSELKHRYTGFINNVRWPALDRCEIVCSDLDAEMSRPGLTDTICRTCTTYLGSPKCGVNLNVYRVEASIQSLNAVQVTSAAFAAYPDGWFAGGYIEWPIGQGEYDRRTIESHVGSTLKLLGGTYPLLIGAGLRVYPGCDFTIQTCHDKYDNKDNFRGQPQLDGKSPFDGKQVF